MDIIGCGIFLLGLIIGALFIAPMLRHHRTNNKRRYPKYAIRPGHTSGVSYYWVIQKKDSGSLWQTKSLFDNEKEATAFIITALRLDAQVYDSATPPALDTTTLN